MSDPYEQDEWYDENYSVGRIDEWSYEARIGKSKNGHLYTMDINGYKYEGQDWGETVDQWKITTYRLSELEDDLREVALKFGRDLKPGDEVYFPWERLLDEEEWDEVEE